MPDSKNGLSQSQFEKTHVKNLQPIHFDNSYARLPSHFYNRQNPVPVASPSLIRVNRMLAGELDIDADWLESAEGIAVAAGNHIPAGAAPIATVYAGHQFGGWSPQLGDGRAILLGEVVTTSGARFDLQLKGSGRTLYSRNGDGRAPLGPVLREYIVSEAMAALGVPTTRTLAAVSTGEQVQRERQIPGGVLIRVAQSHIRIGTFEYFAARRDVDALSVLADYVIDRHFPHAREAELPVLAMLKAVIEKQAKLIADWQALGFIHGVMNTDNMLLCGETIDYGPCAFMDAYDPQAVFSSIDRYGRYAYDQQPTIAYWNLARLAETLLPMLDRDVDKALVLAHSALDAFPEMFAREYHARMMRKLGCSTAQPDDEALLADLLTIMGEEQLDYTLTFRRLSELVAGEDGGASVAGLITLPERMQPWLQRWQARLEEERLTPEQRQAQMKAVNPRLIPRNHRVEEVIRAAEDKDYFQPFHQLVEAMSDPFSDDQASQHLAATPRPDQVVRQTFCGT